MKTAKSEYGDEVFGFFFGHIHKEVYHKNVMETLI